MASKGTAFPNRLLDATAALVALLSTPGFGEELRRVSVNWKSHVVTGAGPQLRDMLRTRGFATGDGERLEIDEAGLRLLGKILVDLGQICRTNTIIAGKFQIDQLVKLGHSSATVIASNLAIGRKVVLKIVRPGVAQNLHESLARLARVKEDRCLVHPIDLIELQVPTINGGTADVPCLVFPYVDGVTLEEYLATSPPLSPYFFAAFIRQVAGALAALEAEDAYHGDLHSGNILVVTDPGNTLRFRIIDVSYGLTTTSEYLATSTDFDQFRSHLVRALSRLQDLLPNMSLKRHLRARLYCLIDHLLRGQQLRFQEVLSLQDSNPEYQRFKHAREEFVKAKFREPIAMGLLRYEEITNSAVAVSLFEPYEELLNNLKDFGNAMLFGHRGSGKSTYLAALAFFPEVTTQLVDPRSIFGVHFACRQGEFKQFAGGLLKYDDITTSYVKHIFCLKIIRRMVNSLSESLVHDCFREPVDYEPVFNALGAFVGRGTLGPVDRGIVSPLTNLHAALLRNEMQEIHELFHPPAVGRRDRHWADERALIDFCAAVRRTFPELENTKFYLLFDDAGEPNVPQHAQAVLNDFVVCSNPHYCVKLSTERYAYHFSDSRHKVLEEGHDYTAFDISRVLFQGGGRDPRRTAVERHFKKIVARRLEHWSFRSSDILEYLGDQVIPTDQLVRRLAAGRKNAYYAGWSVVWQLADRTTRNLLELVSAIFAATNVEAATQPALVKPRIQDKAVRELSERKLKSLSYIPGELARRGGRLSLGRKLYEFTTCLGSVFRLYLSQRDPSHTAPRLDEKLAIERNDAHELSPDAQQFLEELVRFGILDDNQLNVSRDDRLRKPIYILNRIYCPVFGISFRRDAHLRLSKGKFEQLLIEPVEFQRNGTHFLAGLEDGGRKINYELFRNF